MDVKKISGVNGRLNLVNNNEDSVQQLPQHTATNYFSAVTTTPNYAIKNHEGYREFFILNFPGNSPQLFYKSSGYNSDFPATIFPTNGLIQGLIVKPHLIDLLMNDAWRLFNLEAEAKSALISEFSQEVVGAYQQTVINGHGLTNEDDLQAGITSFKGAKLNQHKWQTLCRLGSLEDMKVSCAFGGGIWDSKQPEIAAFSNWFKQQYSADITNYQNLLNQPSVQPHPIVVAKEFEELVPLLSLEIYNRAESEGVTKFQHIINSALGVESEDDSDAETPS